MKYFLDLKVFNGRFEVECIGNLDVSSVAEKLVPSRLMGGRNVSHGSLGGV